MREINEHGILLIQSFEKCTLVVEADCLGIPTVGWGHTGHGLKLLETITQDLADQLFREDIDWAVRMVDKLTSDVKTTDNQFAAMVSLAFNIGVSAFGGSNVLSAHRLGNYGTARASFRNWDHGHINGALVEVPGLLRRRLAEAQLYWFHR